MTSSAPAFAEDLPPLPEGPLLLTSARPEMFSPDYWINRIPEPNKPLKTPEELRRFNEDILREIPEHHDIFRLPAERAGKPLRDQMEFEYETLKGRRLFGRDDQPIPKSVFEERIKPLAQWEKVPKRIKVRWGVATRETSVRALPSGMKMLEAIGDYEFDQLQFTLIKLWTPVAIYHESSDGKWVYLQAPYIRGWARAKDIALFDSREAMKKFVQSDDFLMVTGESISIYRDPELRDEVQRVSMGTRLPLTGDAYVVWLPVVARGGEVYLRKAYVNPRDDVSIEPLPFTPRNIIQQEFKLLGARYGWGGTYKGRDCSGFTQDVFLSLGVDMPRGSKWQTFVGTQIDHFKPFEERERKIEALRKGFPGITLLTMPLHQMILLGEENGHFYVIHSTWAERVSKDSDLKRRINQVVVSDLTLNGDSYLGSLFDRIISVNEIN